jgi:hypothetical protein
MRMPSGWLKPFGDGCMFKWENYPVETCLLAVKMGRGGLAEQGGIRGLFSAFVRSLEIAEIWPVEIVRVPKKASNQYIRRHLRAF